ncbi:hypothetical protein CPB86DRAFT_759973 [Serendipita vermifera]|nr:hypothetical protein CPB86DRAFT_759973 [Serendipita vermifera]
MSDTNAQLNSMPSAETTTSTTPTNTSTDQTLPSSLLPPPESPGSGQEITYFSQNSSNLQTNSYSNNAQASPTPHKSPAGPCYTREELFHLKKSPLVAPPPGMPSRKEWFGEYSEQASKSKDHEGLAATRMRHRRDADPDDPTRTLDSSRTLFKSGTPQPSQMGSFRHQSYRDRGADIDKDTAHLKSMAERYDRGDRLGPLSPSMAGFTGRVKGGDSVSHFGSSTAPRVGAVPAGRAPGREPRQRKPGDEATDWRKNADPARERTDSRTDTGRSGRERDTSRSRAGEDTNGEKKRRDRSRDEDSRRWREDAPGPGRKGRDPSSSREERDTNTIGRSGRKRTEDEERAEANRKRKEERDKETPAWLDDDIPIGPSSKGIVGAKVGDELDELQKWKLEKKAKEEQREREEREALNQAQAVSETNLPQQDSATANLDEHKTPRPSNSQSKPLPSVVPPLPVPANTSAPEMPNTLDHLKALMAMSKDATVPTSNGSMSRGSPSTPLENASPISAVSRTSHSASSINYEAMAKASADESGRSIPDFDPPAVSRHAFAQPRSNPSPSPIDPMGISQLNKADLPKSSMNGPLNLGGPPGLRALQSTEPSHRTRNVSDASNFLSNQMSRSSQNASPAQSLGSGSEASFAGRQPPPHMSATYDSAPLFHLPASAGAGPMDGNMNALSVVAPQPQHSTGLNAAMGLPSRIQNVSPQQQNLLARLGILGSQERRSSPKTMDVGAAGMSEPRMPVSQQQQYGINQLPSSNRNTFTSPVNDRFDPQNATFSSDGRFNMTHNPPSSAASSGSFGPSPVGGANPAHSLSAKGSRLAKFFDNPREDAFSSPSLASPPISSANANGVPTRSMVTPPSQFDDNKNQVMPDLLALLQGANLHGNQSQNRMNMAQQQQQILRDEAALLRERQLALQQQQQQQQLREREARRLEQQLYSQNSDYFDSRGSFTSNDLVPGLRPMAPRLDRDYYNSERIDDRLAYSAQGRVPGVPGGYDQMMRNMNMNAPPRSNMNAYGGPGIDGSSQASADILQQMRRRQEAVLHDRQQEIQRAQILAMQSGQQLRPSQGNLQSQSLGPQNLDALNRGGRFNDVQNQQYRGYGNLSGDVMARQNQMNMSGMGLSANPNDILQGGNQLSGYDLQQRQQQLRPQQQRQGGMAGGYPAGGLDSRYSQQNQIHGQGIQSQGAGQPADLMALLLAGGLGNQQG